MLDRCSRCALRLGGNAAVCGACLRTPPAFDATVAAADYAHPWTHLIARLKFHDGLDVADALALRLAEAVRDRPRPDWIVPVPLSPQRLRQRGYNQSWELARRVGRRLQVSADAGLLLRLRDTPHQTSLSLQARRTSLQGAFAAEPRRRHEIAGRSVAVVDDVMTSGATAEEAAVALRQAGARRVEIWVLARTA